MFDTREEARLYLFEHIEIFYNRQRHETALGHMTPVEEDVPVVVELR